jgi:AraC family transcriptional regulator, regulatory protein of adaptative response / DNA-3-methyladenine glycosylase II
VELDFEWCYRAVTSRDSRFDGWFYTGVTSTGIYCRPSCPARTPHRRNVRFYATTATAQAAGLRACLRCRPDAVPGSPEWDVRADVVGRAMRLIGEGVVDREGVPGLARRLGYTERHLHRLLSAAVGTGPLPLARAQRAQTARTLVETTELGLAEIAFAAGFGSVRQFNDTLRVVFGVAPSQLRRRPIPERAGGQAADRALGMPSGEADRGGLATVTLRLAYRPPLHVPWLLDFLGARAVPGLDSRQGDTYHRALRLPYGTATVALTPKPGHVIARLRPTDLRDLAPAVARCRWLLDLDADPVAVDQALAGDPALARHVTAEPGVRVPRATDGFEMAVRAVVGQQISVSGARTVLTRLLTAAAGSLATGLMPFPEPAEILALPDDAFAMPARRRVTIRALSEAVAAGDIDLGPGADREVIGVRLRAIPGIGDWTADYIAMRALGDPDIFLPTDLGARRGAAALGLPCDVATPKGR